MTIIQVGRLIARSIALPAPRRRRCTPRPAVPDTCGFHAGLAWRRAASPVLPSGSHEIRNVDVRSLRAFVLEGSGLANPRCHTFTEPDLDCGDGCDEYNQRDEPDLHEVSCRGVCFHDPTLRVHRLRALIERIYSFIDATDGCRCCLPRHCGLRHHPGSGPASPG